MPNGRCYVAPVSLSFKAHDGECDQTLGVRTHVVALPGLDEIVSERCTP